MGTLKIAVSGANGFIGTKLCQSLKSAGFDVWPMVRVASQEPNKIFYDYENKHIDLDKLSECFAVIHLAGRNIMSGLWTRSFKQELYDSRVKSTRFIAHSLGKLSHGPKILLNASAVGIYGDQSDLKLDEESHLGTGFLARLCQDWERSTSVAKHAGIRVVNMRFGNVFDAHGGMLNMIAPLFKLGLGGCLGSGAQFLSFVTRDELVAQILFLLKHDSILGPVNMVAKEPVTNEEFTKTLAAVFLKKPFLAAPAFLLKLLGEQGQMLLSSVRAYPRVLLDQGFPFADDHSIEKVLREIFSTDAK